jgi:prepilin-type N-terminal cleavage/methylation domain-containing protein
MTSRELAHTIAGGGEEGRLAAAGRSLRPGGFTMLELTLVLALMASLLALAAPKFRGFSASREVHDTASSILTLIKWARMQAIDEGRLFRLYVDMDLQEYWVAGQEGSIFVAPRVSLGQRFLVPDGVLLKWETSQLPQQRSQRNSQRESQRNSPQSSYIEFDPSGRAEVATLRLTGRLGAVLDVTCRTPREPYRIVPRPEEEVLYE